MAVRSAKVAVTLPSRYTTTRRVALAVTPPLLVME
jgi:hypothetical protein